MVAIAVDGLRKSFGETVALAGVSVRVDAGEVFGIVGPNGAGKTTLVRCLTGTLQPDAGTVRVLDSSPRRVSAQRIGYLPQDFAPPDRLTPRELIAYYAGLFDRSESVERVLETVGVGAVADTWYEHLSGGERRRTLVGSVLVNRPDVLFLDEPTTGIDPAGRRAVWRVLEELVAGGTTIVLTTHYMEEAEVLADRVGMLVDGELAAAGSPSDLVAEYGGASELVIETSTPIDLPGFDSTVHDDEIVVHGISPRDIGAVVDRLEARDATYDGLVWRTPDLESVYLALSTGEPSMTSREDA